jgi:hypothetical protein
MARSDANEQIKEILRQLIRHRFWIALGFACLFAVVAYFMGSGPVKAKAATEISKIKSAESGVKAYAANSKPTDQYKPIVEEKTQIAGKDVNKAWKELYERQAPLLTWPEAVENRIPKWGREWPKDHDAGKVQLAILDYVMAYPEYVTMVYKTFVPFDYETGKGIVAAPTKEALLRPSVFETEVTKLPTLGKVWWAQERLWIQRTMFDVVRQVNRQAKDWDTAIIKEIVALQVGNPNAQDQRSLANGEQLNEAADILSPEQEAAKTASTTDTSGGPGPGGMMTAGGPGGRGRGEMMPGMMGAMMGSGGGAAMGADENVYYITPADDKGQYRILPVLITVLVDQDHVQDLLVELENSPMSIQVKDFELERPGSQVTKPEKGDQRAGMGMMGMMGGGMMYKMMGMGTRGFAGQSMMMEQMRASMMMNMGGGGMPGMAAGMYGGMMRSGGMATERNKVDVRNQDLKGARTKKIDEIEKRKGPSLFDPYFNIVQVTVYGQARFYNPPPAEAVEATQSPGEAAASPSAPAAPAEAPAAEKKAEPAAEKKAEAPAGGPETSPAKPAPEAGAAETKPDAAKPAEDKPTGPGTDAAKPDAQGAAPKK